MKVINNFVMAMIAALIIILIIEAGEWIVGMEMSGFLTGWFASAAFTYTYNWKYLKKSL